MQKQALQTPIDEAEESKVPEQTESVTIKNSQIALNNAKDEVFEI